MRLFFAVDFSSDVKRIVHEAIEDIPIKKPPWRWVATDNLHITLRFLGEMDEDALPSLYDCASSVTALHAPFSITLGALGGFPSIRNPRVLFYRFEQGLEPLAAVAAALDGAISERLGVDQDRRPFKAHATIARIKTRIPEGIVRKLEAVPPLPDVTQAVDRIVLMESKLSSQGARYQCLKAFALSKSR